MVTANLASHVTTIEHMTGFYIIEALSVIKNREIKEEIYGMIQKVENCNGKKV